MRFYSYLRKIWIAYFQSMDTNTNTWIVLPKHVNRQLSANRSLQLDHSSNLYNRNTIYPVLELAAHILIEDWQMCFFSIKKLTQFRTLSQEGIIHKIEVTYAHFTNYIYESMSCIHCWLTCITAKESNSKIKLI